MFEPKHTIIKRYLTWTFIMIVFLLISGIAVANDNFYTKILPIEPDEVNGQYCFIKVTIKQNGDEIIKEEVMECADGKRKADGLGYWDLFAQFYYSGISMPAYCRPYARPNHPFKTPGMLCLSENGVWEKQ